MAVIFDEVLLMVDSVTSLVVSEDVVVTSTVGSVVRVVGVTSFVTDAVDVSCGDSALGEVGDVSGVVSSVEVVVGGSSVTWAATCHSMR